MNRPLIVSLLVVASLLASSRPLSAAEKKTAADLLPASTLVYAEIAEPAKLLEVALNHPLRAKLEAIDDFKKALDSNQFKQFQGVVAFIELKLGMKWQEAVAAAAGDGIYAGFDPQTQGVALLAKARDKDQLTKIRETFLSLAAEDAKNNGKPSPVENKEYRGLTAHKLGEGVLVQFDQWLLVTNKGDLAKSIVDTYLDGGPALASNENFKAARAADPSQPTAWAFVDVETARNAGLAKDLYKEKTDNPAAEILVGGLLSTLQKTPYATVSLNVAAEGVSLAAAVPHDSSWTPKRREYFFGADGKGSAPPTLRPKQTLFTLDAYRDISNWWLAKEDLYEENVTAQLAQADSQFSTIFSGLDFGQEVLGAVGPEVQIVVARQDYQGLDTPLPAIKLPAGAAVFQLNEPDKIQRRFKIAYQSFIGFINIALAQQGQPQLDMNSESRGDARLVSASYLPEDGKEGLINYNFSPTIAFVGDQFVISSTRGLANELVDLLARNGTHEKDREVDNTRAALDLQVLAQVLEDNRTQLVTQNALEKGHGKEAAEKEIGTLLDLLEAGSSASLRLATSADMLKLEVDVRFTDAK